MRRIKHILYLAAILIWAACTNDDIGESPNPNSDTAVQLSAGISGIASPPAKGEYPEGGRGSDSTSPETRATDTSWHTGDAIGLYMLEAGTQNISRNMANRRYINSATGSTANFAPDGEANTAWYPSGGDEVDLIAYYPWLKPGATDGMLAVNVSDQSSLPAIDLMTSNLSTGHSSAEDKRTAKLNFAHRLSKIVLNLKKGEGTEWLNLADAKVTISGTPATAVWNLYKREFESRGAAQDIELNMMGGRTTAIVIPCLKAGATDGDAVQFTVRVGDETFVATLPADKPLGSGKQLDITIRLDYTQPVIEAEITDWITGTEVEIPALTINLPAGPSGAPAVQAFSLWRTGDPSDVRTYTWNDDAGQWTATPAPFYIENLTPGETLQASHTLSTDPLTGVDDVISTPATVLKDDYTLGLEFSHANAKVALTLTAADGFPTVDWSQASVKILGYERTLTGASHSFIMLPGEIATGTTLVTIEVEGITYAATVGTAIALDAGKIAQVEVELQATEAGIVSVSYQPWTPVDGGELTAVNVDAPQFGNSTQAQTMTISKIGSTATYTYTWTDGKWIPNGTALYIENIGNSDRFTATATISTDDVTGVEDVIEAGATSLVNNTLTFDFKHTKAKLNIILNYGDNFDTGANLNDAKVYLLGYPKERTGKTTHEYIMASGISIPSGTQIAKVVLNNQEYSAAATSIIRFDAGTETTITVKLSGTAVGIDANVNPWTEIGNTDLSAVIINTPSHSAPKNLGTIKVWKVGNEANPTTYGYAGGKWGVTGGPTLYIEKIAPTDKFKASATVSAENDVTGLYDDLETVNAVGLSSNTLALTFTHVNAKLTLKLSSLIFTPTELKSAVVTLAFNNTGGKTVTGALSYGFILPAGTTVAAGDVLATFKIKDINYSLKATGAITFAKHSDTGVTALFNGNEPGINVAIDPWDEKTGSGNIESTDVTKGIDLSALPGEGKVTITLDGFSGVEYTWNGSTLTPVVSPIYWENFQKYESGTDTKAKYKFSFRYEPDAYTGLAKDIVYQNDKVFTWGDALSFPNLLHENTEIVVVLKKGSTYSDADWSQARVKLTGFAEAASHTLTQKSTATNLEMNPVVVTQGQASLGKYVNLTLNEVEYKAEIGKLNGINNATLAGGKSYRLELTLERTQIGVGSVTIEDFDEVPGSGNIEY